MRVEDILVEATANRLVLATCGGERPRKVRAGDIIMPPPTPIIDPNIPAINPTITKKAKIKKSCKSDLMPIISITIPVS